MSARWKARVLPPTPTPPVEYPSRTWCVSCHLTSGGGREVKAERQEARAVQKEVSGTRFCPM